MMCYEKLEVYRLSLDCVEHCLNLLDERAKRYSDLCSQLRRAVTSIALNIAEGAGKTLPRDKGRYYEIARGSAMESAAVCDILFRMNAIDEPPYQRSKEILERVVAMLSRMCINTEQQARRRNGR